MATGGDVLLRLALLLMPLATTPLLAAAQPMFTVSAARRVRYTRRDRAAVLHPSGVRLNNVPSGLMTGILQGYTLEIHGYMPTCVIAPVHVRQQDETTCYYHNSSPSCVACCVLDTGLLRV